VNDESEDRRTDYPTRERLEEVHEAIESHVDCRIDKAINAMWIVGVACIIAIGLSLLAMKKVGDESNNRIDAINDSRLTNTFQTCVGDSDKNGVIQNFILFATGQDKNGRLFTKAVKVFPVKNRVQCEKEAAKKVRP
jgi:hypothetical protein